MALVFYKKHQNLRVRFMIQLTPLHNLLWQILCLGGLISVDRILPLLRFLVKIRRNRLALEILRIPLNMIYIKQLNKSRKKTLRNTHHLLESLKLNPHI